MVLSEGSHSQFDTALMEVSFFQTNRHKDFTGSVDKVCGYYYKYIYIYIFFLGWTNRKWGHRVESKPSAST